MQSNTKHCSRGNKKFVTRTASILLRAKALILSDSESDDHSLQSSESSGRPARANRKKVKQTRRCKSLKATGDQCSSSGWLYESHTSSGHPISTPLYGKRKRCSTMTVMSFSGSGEQQSNPMACASKSGSWSHSRSDGQMDVSCSPSARFSLADSMELDQEETSSLSDTSTECGSQHYDEADDEQSDFNEVLEKSKDLSQQTTTTRPVHQNRVQSSHQSKIRSHAAAPVLRNPFATITASTSDRIERSASGGSSSLWKKRRRSLVPDKCVPSA